MISFALYQKKRRNATVETRRRIARAEWVLLGLTALFLALLLGLYAWDMRAADAPMLAETELTVPMEEVRPDPSPVNINTASAEELTALPGIGEELARRIVDYREANGPFASEEALTEVSGIGQGKLAALEGWITVEERE